MLWIAEQTVKLAGTFPFLFALGSAIEEDRDIFDMRSSLFTAALS